MLRVLSRKARGYLQTQCNKAFSTTAVVCTEEEDFLSSQRQDVRRAEKGVNKVTLLGRVGRDPDYRGSEEYPCVIFPLATNHSFYKKSGEYVTRTDWHRICIFKPGLRSIASRVGKGDRIYIEGSISYQKYQDSDKVTNITSILADEIVFLSERRRPEMDRDSEEDL